MSRLRFAHPDVRGSAAGHGHTISVIPPKPHWVRFVDSVDPALSQGNAHTIIATYPEYHWVRFVDSVDPALSQGNAHTIIATYPEYHWVRFVDSVDLAPSQERHAHTIIAIYPDLQWVRFAHSIVAAPSQGHDHTIVAISPKCQWVRFAHSIVWSSARGYGRSPRPRCRTAQRMSERSKPEPVAPGSDGLSLSVCRRTVGNRQTDKPTSHSRPGRSVPTQWSADGTRCAHSGSGSSVGGGSVPRRFDLGSADGAASYSIQIALGPIRNPQSRS
jgi:hypothetical protein